MHSASLAPLIPAFIPAYIRRLGNGKKILRQAEIQAVHAVQRPAFGKSTRPRSFKAVSGAPLDTGPIFFRRYERRKISATRSASPKP
jgi:hypothetical protein